MTTNDSIKSDISISSHHRGMWSVWRQGDGCLEARNEVMPTCTRDGDNAIQKIPCPPYIVPHSSWHSPRP